MPKSLLCYSIGLLRYGHGWSFEPPKTLVRFRNDVSKIHESVLGDEMSVPCVYYGNVTRDFASTDV